MTSDFIKANPFNATQAKETHYKGIACSPGVFTGKLVEFKNTDDIDPMHIYLFPHASPTFTQAFKKAPALIFKQGSPLAHGAIVAREMKKPAVVITQDISHLIGKNITINGEKGTIQFPTTY